MNTLPIRKLSSLVAAAAVLALVGAGTAEATATAAPAAQKEVQQGQTQAPPRGKAAATANPLYRTGLLPRITCSPGEIRPGSAASYKAFMSRVNTCLNTSWARQFRKAGLSFSKPRLRFATSRVSSPCGRWPSGAGGYYCSSNRTIYIGVTKRVLREAFELGLAQFMAHEYAHHVQTIAGIGPNYYFPAYSRARGSAKLLLSRRFELQADCLGAAFVRSVADTLPVNPQEWDGMVQWTRENGAKTWPTNDHGKGYSQAYWLEKGFAAGGPGGCNTWTVSARRVA
ncbi:hypothetical protein HNP84_000725 [Thermocatellispora tengchongensis]|uniref:Metalloprotease n=2 Tax=Thermocatellispora tengchongensis TaxID=1073253 RepID=A0A840NW33_9ACTN|nr:neutral zinc metallopeptidase [Thermocatellispora tengchongensis]MBB5131019.1 hypothetical protein [Thermocatellispora tengchongensis]